MNRNRSATTNCVGKDTHNKSTSAAPLFHIKENVVGGGGHAPKYFRTRQDNRLVCDCFHASHVHTAVYLEW